MRKLWLEIPEINSAISLSGEESINGTEIGSVDGLYLTRLSGGVKTTDLAGLGYAANTGYSFVEPFGYVETKNEIEQPAVSGNINLLSSAGIDAYARFTAFVRLVQGRKLRLRYSPTGGSYASAAYMDGALTKFLKTEKSASRLVCPFEFRGTAPFYTLATKAEATLAANAVLNISPTSGELSNYRNAFTLTIAINQSTPTTPLIAQIYHYNTGAPVAQLELNAALAKNDVIVWSSDPENPRVTLNGSDQIFAGAVNLGKKVFDSVTGSDLRFTANNAVKVTTEYKAYNWSV